MSLDIRGKCIIEDCQNDASRVLNLRARRRDTGAVFGSNIRGANLCPDHADNGMDVAITVAPNRTGIMRLSVNETVTYSHPVKNGHPDQDSLGL